MEPYVARLQAVMSIQPPVPTDGELRCTTPGCKSDGRLSRRDRECWWCGGQSFEIVSEDLKVWMRIPEVPKATSKPRTVMEDYLDEALKHYMKQLSGRTLTQQLGWPMPHLGPTQATAPMVKPAVPTQNFSDLVNEVDRLYMESAARYGLTPTKAQVVQVRKPWLRRVAQRLGLAPDMPKGGM